MQQKRIGLTLNAVKELINKCYKSENCYITHSCIVLYFSCIIISFYIRRVCFIFMSFSAKHNTQIKLASKHTQVESLIEKKYFIEI